MHRMQSGWVVIPIGLLLAIVLIYFGIGTYMGLALTRPQRLLPPAELGTYAANQVVSITARDGVRLAAWFYPKPDSRRAIIFAHGLNGCSLCSFEGKFPVFQRQLNDAGYNLLAFDFRGHGQSEGTYVTFGEEERWDILGAIDWLHQRGFTQIAVVGTSLGAVSTVRTDLEVDGAQSIKAMVLDSCFTDFGDVLDRNFADVTGYPTFLLPGGLLMTRLLLHVDMAGVKPINDLPRTRAPLLMIYGDHDRYVTLAQENAMAAARPDAEFWLAAGPAHSAIYDRYPTESIAHVTQFLTKAMP